MPPPKHGQADHQAPRCGGAAGAPPGSAATSLRTATEPSPTAEPAARSGLARPTVSANTHRRCLDGGNPALERPAGATFARAYIGTRFPPTFFREEPGRSPPGARWGVVPLPPAL